MDVFIHYQTIFRQPNENFHLLFSKYRLSRGSQFTSTKYPIGRNVLWEDHSIFCVYVPQNSESAMEAHLIHLAAMLIPVSRLLPEDSITTTILVDQWYFWPRNLATLKRAYHHNRFWSMSDRTLCSKYISMNLTFHNICINKIQSEENCKLQGDSTTSQLIIAC